MSVRLVVKNSSPPSVFPYRLLDDRGCEVTWANLFLDAQTVRQLSLRSLRLRLVSTQMYVAMPVL